MTVWLNLFQVLPLVTEVVRWFDIKPLEILWNNYLSREHTLLCYGSCIALRYSILHAGRLMHFLEQPPPSWKVRSNIAPPPPPPPGGTETVKNIVRNMSTTISFHFEAISEYRKIPIIRPGLIFVQRDFLVGLFQFGEACFWRILLSEGVLRFKIGWA